MTTILAQTLGYIPGFVNVGEYWHYGIAASGTMSAAVAGNSLTRASSAELSSRKTFGRWENVDVDKMVEFRPYVERRRYTPHYALAAKTSIRNRKMNSTLEE